MRERSASSGSAPDLDAEPRPTRDLGTPWGVASPRPGAVRERASEASRNSAPFRSSTLVDRDDDPLHELAGGRPRWQKIALIFAGVSFVLGVAALLAIVLVVQHYSQALPDVRKLESGYAPPQVTRVLARDGTPLANIFLERRTVVSYQRIPDHVKTAFLAAEDAGFFQHEGLDYLGMVRAVAANLRAGRVRQGGSTITQQVVKNVLLDHERSYERKIRETILAYRLEKTLSKEQILGMYLNHIYLGHGRYGVQEAARYYFGKNVEELDLPEAALLAGIVAAPERYSPRKDEAKALARRRYVLSQMLDKGFMTAPVFDASTKMPLRLSPVAEAESDIAPEMVGHATRLLASIGGEGAQKGGYTVRTTIDPALQVAARKALRKGLDDYLTRQKLAPPYTVKERKLWGPLFSGMPKRHHIYVGTVKERNDDDHTLLVKVGDVLGVVDLTEENRFNPKRLAPSDFVGQDAALRVRVVDDPGDASADAPVRLRLELGPQGALLALHPHTREVVAAVGSYEALPGGLDRTVQTKRQPGSTFKPLVYSYALSTHQVTAATLLSVPKEKTQGDEGAEFDVLSLREGVAKSDNRVARAVLREAGATQAVQWARTFGITSRLEPTESLMLGAYEVTVAEMAAAFSVFASGGTARDPLFVSQLERGVGDVPLPPRSPERRVMDPAVAYLTTSLLGSVISEGTGRRAQALERPLAGKTGTTNQAKDAWFVGYSTDLVAAVWVGYDDALPLGWGESGATSALPIWIDFMKAAHQDKPATQFPRPSEIVEAEIDPHTGLLARYGQEDARLEIFLPGTVPQETAPSPDETNGAEEGVEPEAGEEAAKIPTETQDTPAREDAEDDTSRGADSEPLDEMPPPF